MFDAILTRLRSLRQRRAVSHTEMDDELRFHLEMETQSNIDSGLTPSEARRRALRDLGGIDQTKEAIRDVRATSVHFVWQDIRYAWRGLRRGGPRRRRCRRRHAGARHRAHHRDVHPRRRRSSCALLHSTIPTSWRSST